MTNDTPIHATIVPEALPRRPWVTPRIFLGECSGSEGGNGTLPTDVVTTSGSTSPGGS